MFSGRKISDSFVNIISSVLLILSFPLSAEISAVVTDGKNHINAVLINDSGVSYILTDYTFAAISGKYKLNDSSGNNLKFHLPPQISSSAGYIKIKLSEHFEDALLPSPAGTPLNIGDKVTVTDGISEENCIITGTGVNLFELSLPASSSFLPGSAVLKNGKLAGLITTPSPQIRINPYRDENKIRLAAPPKLRAVRVNISEKFLPITKYHIINDIRTIVRADTFLPEYVSIVNFWTIYPYRPFPDTFRTLPQLAPWLNEHNLQAAKYPALIKKIRKSPSDFKGLLDSVIENTIKRGERLKIFASVKIKELKTESPVRFISDLSEKRRRQWILIKKTLDAETDLLEHILPDDLKKLNRKLAPKKDTKKKKRKKKEEKRGTKTPLFNTDAVLTGIFPDRRTFLAVKIKFHNGIYAVFSQDQLLNEPHRFKLYSLASRKQIKTLNLELSADSPLARMKIADPDENTPAFELAPVSAKPSVCLALDSDTGLVHAQYITGSAVDKNLKIAFSGGACLTDSKNRLISFSSIKNPFSRKAAHKMIKVITAKWSASDPETCFNEFSAAEKFISRYRSLEILFSRLHMYSFSDIPYEISGSYRHWLVQHNINSFIKKKAGKVSPKNHYIKHKYQCLFYNEIIELKSYIRTLLKQSSQMYYSNTYLKKTMNELRSKLNKLLTKTVSKEKDYLKKHPSARPAL